MNENRVVALRQGLPHFPCWLVWSGVSPISGHAKEHGLGSGAGSAHSWGRAGR
jgi:hypothetical protein